MFKMVEVSRHRSVDCSAATSGACRPVPGARAASVPVRCIAVGLPGGTIASRRASADSANRAAERPAWRCRERAVDNAAFPPALHQAQGQQSRSQHRQNRRLRHQCGTDCIAERCRILHRNRCVNAAGHATEFGAQMAGRCLREATEILSDRTDQRAGVILRVGHGKSAILDRRVVAGGIGDRI